MRVEVICRQSVSTEPTASRKEHQMLDVMLLGLGLAFFVLTIGYAYACDRL